MVKPCYKHALIQLMCNTLGLWMGRLSHKHSFVDMKRRNVHGNSLIQNCSFLWRLTLTMKNRKVAMPKRNRKWKTYSNKLKHKVAWKFFPNEKIIYCCSFLKQLFQFMLFACNLFINDIVWSSLWPNNTCNI